LKKNTSSSGFQKLQIALALQTRAILIVFEKLIVACFLQIELETILISILIGLESYGFM
jgi:hypothetical protein